MKRAALICLFLCTVTLGFCKIRIEVKVKNPLPLPESGLYLAASFNNWNPGDPAFKLTQTNDSTYYIELEQVFEHFEYKLTQGSWAYVESDSTGAFISSLQFN